jgi:hypothetical protein
MSSKKMIRSPRASNFRILFFMGIRELEGLLIDEVIDDGSARANGSVAYFDRVER